MRGGRPKHPPQGKIDGHLGATKLSLIMEDVKKGDTMADEPSDVKAPETEVLEGEQETPKAEPSTDKEKPEGEDTKAETPDVPTKDVEEPLLEEEKGVEKPEDKPPEEKPQAEDKPQKGLEKRTEKLNTEIRDLVARRNALKTEVTKANEVYQPATEQELIDEGMDANSAFRESMRQEIAVKDYNEKVAESQLTIESESQRVLHDFPTFNPDSTQFDKELANEAAELLEQNLIYDENTGQIIGTNTSPYQLYKTLARASGISTAKGQMKGQQATEQMLANADSAGSSAPQQKAKDPILEILASDD